LKSAAPSTGFAAGKDICADATPAFDVALQKTNPMASIRRRVLMDMTIGANGA
jgi:hypothetical protein